MGVKRVLYGKSLVWRHPSEGRCLILGTIAMIGAFGGSLAPLVIGFARQVSGVSPTLPRSLVFIPLGGIALTALVAYAERRRRRA